VRTSSHHLRNDQRSARDLALTEAVLFLEAGVRGLAHALLFGDDIEVREAGEHMVVMAGRVRTFLLAAVV
jgi:hypothetical protein